MLLQPLSAFSSVPEGLSYGIMVGSLALLQLQVLLMTPLPGEQKEPETVNEKLLKSMERIESNLEKLEGTIYTLIDKVEALIREVEDERRS